MKMISGGYMYLSIGQTARLVGVFVRRFDLGRKKVVCFPLFGLWRSSSFKLDAIHKACGFQPQRNSRNTIYYARVSSHDQKEDLERQKSSLELLRAPSRRGTSPQAMLPRMPPIWH